MRSTPLPALIVLVALGALAGCAAGRMGPVPSLTSTEPAARVTVQRSRSVLGAPVSMLVKIDGRHVHALRWGQEFSFTIDPGEYRLGYDLGFNHCQQRVVLEPGERYVVRMTPVCQIELFRADELR